MNSLIWIALGLFARWLVEMTKPSNKPGRILVRHQRTGTRRQMHPKTYSLAE